MKLQMKAIRTKLDLKQKEAAQLVNMPVRRYGSYERGERTLSLEDACAIADAFHCTLDELAGREWPPPGTAATAGMDARLTRINEQYADMNERGKVRAVESVDDIHANPKNRAGVSPDAAPAAGAISAA